VEILVRKQYSPGEIWRAALNGLSFKPSRYTSGCANLDNMICETDVRKFSPKAARYRAHPAPNLRRAHGQCDVCRELGLQFLFLNEKDAIEEQKKLEKFKRVVEYGHTFNG
jgi:hypothetical protein